jgi:hypothetical protein
MSEKDKKPGEKPVDAVGKPNSRTLTVYRYCLAPGEYRAPEDSPDGFSRTVFLPAREGRFWIIGWDGPVPERPPGSGDDPQGDS